jgi:hypothetical protein
LKAKAINKKNWGEKCWTQEENMEGLEPRRGFEKRLDIAYFMMMQKQERNQTDILHKGKNI